MNIARRPHLSAEEAAQLAVRHWDIAGTVEELPGERDQNFRITAGDERSFVLKIAHPDEEWAVLDLQRAALERLAGGAQAELFPSMLASEGGEMFPRCRIREFDCRLRLVTWLPGRPIATLADRPPGLLHDIGRRLGILDRELAGLAHPAMHRYLQWDSKHAFSEVRRNVKSIASPQRREMVLRLLREIENRLVPLLPRLTMCVIHNDVNDHNLLVDDSGQVCGIIDFGDMVHTYRVCELANAAAYLMLDRPDPMEIAAEVARGYSTTNPLSPAELQALPDFIVLRLCLSVSIAARQCGQDPDNAYLGISEGPAWTLLEAIESRGLRLDPRAVVQRRTPQEIRDVRRTLLSGALSTSYQQPLHIVRGDGQLLFDENDRRYLDCVNNVCHVGHCHPRVVAAAGVQMATLNTNTRYLHENIVEYAERLTALLPEPLSVCFFVNSGSEANDLALRLARMHTGEHDFVVIDHSYHGHTQSVIDISSYKFDGRGGGGAPPGTHKVPIPDRYRGAHGYDDPDAGRKYAGQVGQAIDRAKSGGRGLAGFIAESFLGVAGQIELPPGYLERAYEQTRDAGGVCIADEVQIGFGRVGSHFWGFEMQGVVPDIVTMGKPIGNGHPLAAVVTTPHIARSFANGMEYFNTYGGNPVSCAVGIAVLDVIETEQLQANARDVGAHFIDGLRELAGRHELIGDVRGRGLFIGVELVRSRTTREPATCAAAEIVEQMKDRGVLLSTDGPWACVIKIKPPMVFSRRDADLVIRALDDVLANL